MDETLSTDEVALRQRTIGSPAQQETRRDEVRSDAPEAPGARRRGEGACKNVVEVSADGETESPPAREPRPQQVHVHHHKGPEKVHTDLARVRHQKIKDNFTEMVISMLLMRARVASIEV